MSLALVETMRAIYVEKQKINIYQLSTNLLPFYLGTISALISPLFFFSFPLITLFELVCFPLQIVEFASFFFEFCKLSEKNYYNSMPFSVGFVSIWDMILFLSNVLSIVCIYHICNERKTNTMKYEH